MISKLCEGTMTQSSVGFFFIIQTKNSTVHERNYSGVLGGWLVLSVGLSVVRFIINTSDHASSMATEIIYVPFFFFFFFFFFFSVQSSVLSVLRSSAQMRYQSSLFFGGPFQKLTEQRPRRNTTRIEISK